MFNDTDLKYYLSGGLSNKLPSKSLGGPPSPTLVKDDVNTLFSRVPKEGGTSYRCMYIVNEGSSTMENVKLYLSQTNPLVSLAVVRRAEVQKITVGSEVVGGYFSLKYRRNVVGITFEQTTNNIDYDADIDVMASNIQNRLNELDYLSGILVVASIVDTSRVFLVSFTDDDNFRNHETLTVDANALFGSVVLLGVNAVTDGSPVNAIADDIGFDNQSPNGAEFSLPSASSPRIVGRLEPLDGFGVWLKRTITDGTNVAADAVDQVVLHIVAQVDQ